MSEGIVTDVGLADLALGYWVFVEFGPHPLYLQFGTGSGATASSLAAAVQDMVLGAWSHLENVFTVTGTITATADNTITEVGVFADPDPTQEYMVFYGDFDGINLATGDAIVFQVNVVFS